MSTEVPGGDPDDAGFTYDEFAYLHENCREHGLELPDPVALRRVSTRLGDGRELSALRWGDEPPRVVFLHGGAQNAHTWDTVVLAMWPTPALAVDLPGHGRSSWRDDGAYSPHANADDVAVAVAQHAPDAELVVGMSLGGLTATSLAARHPDLVRRLVTVDITPGVTRDKAAEVHAFIEGPQRFGSFREIFERTVQFNPTRTPESLRRGILHNAHRLPDGSWEWNYDRGLASSSRSESLGEVLPDLWEHVSAVRAPYTLVRGGASPVVDDDDVAELRRRQPDVEVLVVEGAGHSVQGDRPLELAEILLQRLGRR
jgi:pimeloyl-ACP methyl ester carboxylesterase